MNVRLMQLLFVIALAAAAAAHPPVSVVLDAQGNAHYSDLHQVWKVAPNGTKSIAVPGVHTHELYIDANGNLYGEHLWYEGERTDKWGHYLWRRSPDGKVVKIIANREGFPRDYSFVRDAAGNQYLASTDRKRIEKIARNGQKSVVAQGFSNIRWMISTANATLYLVDKTDVLRVAPNGAVTRLVRNISDTSILRPQVSAQHSVMGLWTDRTGNLYVASFSEGKVKRIAPDGKVKVVVDSSGSWSPVEVPSRRMATCCCWRRRPRIRCVCGGSSSGRDQCDVLRGVVGDARVRPEPQPC